MTLLEPSDAECAEILATFFHLPNADPERFAAYLDFYRDEVCRRSGADLILTMSPPALRTHRAVRAAALHLRSSCTKTKEEFQDGGFPGAITNEKERSTRLVARLAYMIDCASAKDHSVKFRLRSEGGFPADWLKDQSFVDFYHAAFPTSVGAPLRASAVSPLLKGWKLQRRYGIRIVLTNDLVQHLFYNKTHRTLSIFHQIGFLKAHLRHATAGDWTDSVELSLGRGTLPAQLLLETLYSIYDVLFPLHQRKAARMARELVNAERKQDRFDKDFENPGRFDYGNLAHDFKYVYWASRLRALQDIIEKPPPSNKVISLVERHTSERNALTVAIVGLFLSTLFGLLGCIIGVVSVVLQYQAWKYPVG